MSKWMLSAILCHLGLATGCATVHLSQAERAQGIDPLTKRGGLFTGTEIVADVDDAVVEENDADEAQARDDAAAPATKSDGLLFGEATPVFTMPVHGELSSPFGFRHGKLHKGVDLRAPKNTPIHAAATGRVSYVGWIRGYGRTVKVRHGKYETVYAHCRKTNVSTGQDVTTQDVIAYVGKSGVATGYHLHFEYRNSQGKPQDPLPYLQPEHYASNHLE